MTHPDVFRMQGHCYWAKIYFKEQNQPHDLIAFLGKLPSHMTFTDLRVNCLCGVKLNSVPVSPMSRWLSPVDGDSVVLLRRIPTSNGAQLPMDTCSKRILLFPV